MWSLYLILIQWFLIMRYQALMLVFVTMFGLIQATSVSYTKNGCRDKSKLGQFVFHKDTCQVCRCNRDEKEYVCIIMKNTNDIILIFVLYLVCFLRSSIIDRWKSIWTQPRILWFGTKRSRWRYFTKCYCSRYQFWQQHCDFRSFVGVLHRNWILL